MRNLRHLHNIYQKFAQFHWPFLIPIAILFVMGIVMLYSAAEENWHPWALPQLIRGAVGFVGLLIVAVLDLRFWLKLSYFIYVLALILLALVDVFGMIGMGAQRWLDLGPLQIQPSEIMKFALVLSLARYFHGRSQESLQHISSLVVPGLMILVPVGLVLKQPDLGTALILAFTGGALFFAAGVRWWVFAGLGAFAGVVAPIAWSFLHGYQKKRILTFLDPSQDPLGAGYHIIQSKIAFGSGGIWGKGLFDSTQSRLNFLPEKQTDFIFTMIAEEWGMIGGTLVLALYAIVLAYALLLILSCRNQFGRLMGFGVIAVISFYVFINTAMVMGLVPVVGVPLPMISYGGTALLSTLFGFGLVLNAHVHRSLNLPRTSAAMGWRIF